MRTSRRGAGRAATAAEGVLIALLLAAPGTASAATFYVDDDATAPLNPCTNPTPANACDMIGDAITQARTTMGGDTIMVAGGSYAETVRFDDAADVGDVLDGAGSGTGAGATVVAPAGSASGLVVGSTAPDNVTVRDLRVTAAAGQAVYVGWLTVTPGPTGTTLENIEVELNAANSQPAVKASNADNTTLTDIGVSGDADWDRMPGNIAAALEVDNSDNVTVSNSELNSNDVGLFARISDGLVIRRTTIAATLNPLGSNDQPAVYQWTNAGGISSSMTLDSSLVLFGNRGIGMQQDTAGSATATIRNSTIDPGNSKGPTSVSGIDATGGSITASIDSSIVLGTLTSTGTGSITCTYSNVPDTVDTGTSAISCPTSPGNAGGNATSTAAQLFDPNIFGIPNYSLLAGGPAIDTGNPAPLLPSESSTDLPGNARVLDGNLDCVVRRDMGAVEETGLSLAVCPTPPTTAQTPSTQPAPIKKCKKKRKPRSAAASKKKKSCGKRKKKP